MVGWSEKFGGSMKCYAKVLPAVFHFDVRRQRESGLLQKGNGFREVSFLCHFLFLYFPPCFGVSNLVAAAKRTRLKLMRHTPTAWSAIRQPLPTAGALHNRLRTPLPKQGAVASAALSARFDATVRQLLEVFEHMKAAMRPMRCVALMPGEQEITRQSLR
jgi:hypothetical protein